MHFPRGWWMNWGSLIAVALAPVATPATEPHNSEQILRQAVERISQAQAFQFAVDFQLRVGFPGFDHTQQAHYHIAAARPNRFALRRVAGDLGGTVISDGETMWTETTELQQYTQQVAPPSLHVLSESPLGIALLGHSMGEYLTALLNDDPFAQLTTGMTESKWLGMEEVAGTACHHLRLVRDSWDLEVWVSRGERPTICRIQPDMAKLLEEEEMESGFSMQVDFRYRDWNWQPQFSPETFVYTPAGATQLVKQVTPKEPEPVLPVLVSAAEAALHPLVGKPAPEFSLPSLKGEEKFRLADVLGEKVVVLDFWATWCPPCVEGLPKVSQVAQEFADREVLFRAINLDDEAETAREFLTQQQLDLSALHDADGEVFQQYQGRGIPYLVIVGLDRKVQVVHVGLSGDLEQRLTQELEDLLAGKDLAADAIAKAHAATKAQTEQQADQQELPPDQEPNIDEDEQRTSGSPAPA